MRWIVVAAVGFVLVLGANLALLGSGGDRHDPVGRLSPVAHVSPLGPAPAPVPGREDD